MYMGRHLAGIRIGAISQDVKPELVVAALVKEFELEYEIVNINRTKVVK